MFACVVPNYGPEYDALIKITQIESTSKYRIELPKKLENTGRAKVILAYRDITHTGSSFVGAFGKSLFMVLVGIP